MRFKVMSNWLTRATHSKPTNLIACAIVVALVLGGCSAKNPQAESDRLATGATPPQMSPAECEANAKIEAGARTPDPGYRIQPGDSLALDFYMNSEFNDNVTVNPDGKVTLRMVGPVQAAGLTTQQLAAEIDKAYSSELRNPGAVVHLHELPNRQIFVEGQVAKPGSYPLQPGMTAVEALALAGGVTDSAEPASTIVIRRDACGQPQASKVDLDTALKNPGTGNDVALAERDVVVVPRSRIANADLWVKQHIRDILPVEPYLSPTF
jgi:protein involved in polysaccharide export with SLBB domain